MKIDFKEKLETVVPLALLYMVTVGTLFLAATRVYRPVAGFDPIRRGMLILLLPLLIKYVFQLICSPLYSTVERARRKKSTSDEPLSVSVLIPAWNEEIGIERTIRSVLNTEYSRLQVVVINDGSTDGTHEKVTQVFAEYEQEDARGASLKYLNLSNGGKARAMNCGLTHATGEIIITIDADSVMDPNAISNILKRFTDPKVGGVAGNVVVGNKRKPIEWMQQMEYLYGFFFKRTDSLFNSVYIIGGAAAAYRRDALDHMGGFDHAIITEDIEMSTRMLAHGYKTRYAADAVVYTEGPSDFKSLCNQRLRWRYGRILTFIKHRKLFFSLKSEHRLYLSWFLLPLAVYAELLLLAEVIMLSTFFIYTVYTSDYLPLVLVIALLSAVIGIQILADSKVRFHRNLVLFAPIAWLVFYAMDMIEFQALIRSLRRLATRKELKWQKWSRVGVFNDAIADS